MGQLNNIVQVTISRATAQVTMQAFNGILIADEFLMAKTTTPFAATERVLTYSSLTAMTSDGWTSSDFVYKAAAAAFSQSPAPSQVFVGRKLTGADGSETWTAALAAILLYNSNWYGFCISSRTMSDQSLGADWAEANKRYFFIASSDANNLVSGSTTDIGYYISNKSYTHSAVFYSPNAGQTGEDCIDAAIMGKQFPYAPGSSGYAYKTLADVAAYTLTDTHSAAALAKQVNIYTSLAGVNCTQMGTSGSGEWIDIIIGIDWLTADIQTAIFTALVNNQKIPYTDTGVQMVVNPLNGALRDGVNNGLLSDAPNAITITYPVVSSVSAATKGTRLLPNVNFVAILAGAIYFTQINGTLTY